MLETAASPNNSGTYIAKTKLALISTYPSMDLLVCLATRAHLGGWTMHGMAWPGMTWHGIAWPGMAWHGMRTTPGARGAACQLPPSESRGALLGVMVVEFASAIGIHTFCKVLYRSHRSPSDALMP